MKLSGRGTDATTKTCALCGRVGVRRFTTMGFAYPEERVVIVCSNQEACRRKWPECEREAEDD